MRLNRIVIAAGTTAMVGAAGMASAATLNYAADIAPLNGSGVSGSATFAYNNVAQTLRVDVNVSGFKPSEAVPHAQHIHGFGSLGIDATTPDIALDTATDPIELADGTMLPDGDGDGLIEILEGVRSYGGIILPLDDSEGAGGMFPSSNADGELVYSMLFNLADTVLQVNPITGEQYSLMDLVGDLTMNEYVIHTFDPQNNGARIFEAQGQDGVIGGLPAGSGVIRFVGSEVNVVPLPAAGFLLLGGLGGLAAFRRRKA